MKTFLFKSVCVLFLVLTSFSSFSQKKKKESSSEPHFSVVGKDSISVEFANYLEEATSKHFQDPSIPRFLIKDRSDRFVFGVGGYVAALGYYDYNNLDDPSFIVSEINTPTQAHSADKLNLYMGLTRLSFRLTGKTKAGMINAYIETDFLNDNQIMRLRHAYVEYLGIKVGQTWTTYRDEESIPTLDPQGPISLSQRRVPQISYSYKFKNGIKLSAGIEFSQSTSVTYPVLEDTTVVPQIDNVAQSFPDVPLSFSYTNDKFHIYAGVNIRYMKFTRLEEYFPKQFTFSTQVSGNWAFYKNKSFSHTLFWHGIYAYGMLDCIQDLTDQGLDIIAPTVLDRTKVIPAYAFHFGYQFRWLHNNEINMIYSYAHTYDNSNLGYSHLYRTGQYACVNYLRKVLTYGVIGAEVLGGKRMNVNGDKGWDFRINLLLRYDF